MAELFSGSILSNMLYIRRENADINNCTQTGLYQIGSNVSNAPENWLLLLVLCNPEGGSVFQFAVRVDNTKKTFIRTKESESAQFTDWCQFQFV